MTRPVVRMMKTQVMTQVMKELGAMEILKSKSLAIVEASFFD